MSLPPLSSGSGPTQGSIQLHESRTPANGVGIRSHGSGRPAEAVIGLHESSNHMANSNGNRAEGSSHATLKEMSPEEWDREISWLAANFWHEAALTLIQTACTLGLLYAASELIKRVVPSMMDGEYSEKSTPELDHLAKRLDDCGRDPNIANSLNKYELRILSDLVEPTDVGVAFKDIGGLASQKQDVIDTVILPLKQPELYLNCGSLVSPPKGILLHGPPGCGKSMMAKAIASETRAMFIDLSMSTIMSKYHGESEHLVKAVFTLGRKLSPCIIFIDEIDAFLKDRGMDHGGSNVGALMKQGFLSEWDGIVEHQAESRRRRRRTAMSLGTGSKQRKVEDSSGRKESSSADPVFGVMIIGATNRPGDIDPAFLRRMPRHYKLNLPNMKEREEILKIMFEELGPNGVLCHPSDIAAKTQDYSGSDLKNLCQVAAHMRVRDKDPMRALTQADFENALKRSLSTKQQSINYRLEQKRRDTEFAMWQ